MDTGQSDQGQSMEPTEINYSGNQAPQIIDAAWEVWLDAPLATAWQRTVQEVDGWWAHCYKPDSTVLIEAFPGGRFWERFADGVNGSVYANVVYIEPQVVLKCIGQWAMPGIGLSSGAWRFEAKDGGTLLKATGQMIGLLDARLMQERKGGSQSLITALRKWVEQGESVTRS